MERIYLQKHISTTENTAPSSSVTADDEEEDED
jgi:hypothetical protein